MKLKDLAGRYLNKKTEHREVAGMDSSKTNEQEELRNKRMKQLERQQETIKQQKLELEREREGFFIDKALSGYNDMVVKPDVFRKLVAPSLVVQDGKVLNKETGEDAEVFINSFLKENEYLVRATATQGTGARQPMSSVPEQGQEVDVSTPEGLTNWITQRFNLKIGPARRLMS